MTLQEIIAPERIRCPLEASSKKRLLELLATVLCDQNPSLDERAAFQSLFERERLGSTGVGNGVAIPHGRMPGLDVAVGAFAVLASPMDYEAIDDKPVTLVFALLVPEAATTEHLQLLSQIATVLSDADKRAALRAATGPSALYRLLCDADSTIRAAS